MNALTPHLMSYDSFCLGMNYKQGRTQVGSTSYPGRLNLDIIYNAKTDCFWPSLQIVASQLNAWSMKLHLNKFITNNECKSFHCIFYRSLEQSTINWCVRQHAAVSSVCSTAVAIDCKHCRPMHWREMTWEFVVLRKWQSPFIFCPVKFAFNVS